MKVKRLFGWVSFQSSVTIHPPSLIADFMRFFFKKETKQNKTVKKKKHPVGPEDLVVITLNICTEGVFKIILTHGDNFVVPPNRQRQELLALSAYVGALLAIRRKYDPIVHPLFKHAR